MNNHLNDVLDRLAAKARQETAPPVDTVARVLTRIQRRERLLERPLAIFAAGSLAMAAGVALFVVPLIQTMADPLGAVFQMSAGMLP